jgi:microcystin-dependent protein
MFSNRRKRIEQNKIVYYQNQLSSILSPKPDLIPELQEKTLWEMSGNNIYNTNSGNVGIGIHNPLWQLDVSGSINVTKKIMINTVSIAPPIGSIMAYVSSIVAPDGWLICDGSAVSRAIYAGLFSVIGTTFGSGNASTTFNLPDYRGAFLRGTGQNGIYSGPNIGVPQYHATQVHNHTATSSVTDPGHTHLQNTVNDDFNGTGGTNFPNSSSPSFGPYDGAGIRTWTNIDDSTTGVQVSTSIANSTGANTDANETRPYNFGVYWIIKY